MLTLANGHWKVDQVALCYTIAAMQRSIRRGVSRQLAWNTRKSAHGPWRLSRSPALSFALPTGHFVGLGLPLLHHEP